MHGRRLARGLLLLAATLTASAAAWADPPEDTHPVLQTYLARAAQREAAVAQVQKAFGRPFAALTDADYAAFLQGLDLRKPEDLWTWSHVTGIPVLALDQGHDFLRVNAHLLADAEAARKIPIDELQEMSSKVREGNVTVTTASGEALELRADAAQAIRQTGLTGQIRHNRDFAEDTPAYDPLRACLVRLEDVGYLEEVAKALRVLPLSLVQVLRGKAIYLTTRRGGRTEVIWHCTGSTLNAGCAGMQPGVVVEADGDGKAVEPIVRGLARLVRETVLESQYFGVYAHPWQFPAFQRLQPERRHLFGRRRDRLAQTPHGYVNEAAMRDAQANFVEHLTAYLLERDAFRQKAEQQNAEGHRGLLQKFRFIETLVEATPTTAERLRAEHLTALDADDQRAILKEYKSRQAESPAVRARVEDAFHKPFPEFSREDYARFLGDLELLDDDDLWTWSHVTAIPVVGLDKRSNFFHQNAHLLADVERANGMSWHDLHDLATTYDRKTGTITIRSKKTGEKHAVRNLPPGTVRHLETTEGLRHNEGWAEDRIAYEALAFCLVRLADLENRADLNEVIRTLPLSIVKAHRGKAIYPTTRARTGWAFTWRVSTEDNPSYVGMIPGGLVECRRDGARARVPPDELVDNGYDSLTGTSTDSAIHEIAHVIDLNVIGARKDNDAHPYQFPAMRALVGERHEIFAMTAQKDVGYVSAYSKVNAQENFAEHFWAYVRDPQDFLARARQEQADGHDLLLRKYRFMEKLVEHTPSTMHRLSPAYLELKRQALGREIDRDRENRLVRQEEVLAEYLARYAERERIVADVEKQFGKPFHEFTRKDYAAYMADLDLDRDEDLWAWSHVTGIPVLALCRTSSFFSSNTHLLADVEAAMRMSARQSYALKTEVDKETLQPVVKDASGKVLPLRDLPDAVLHRIGRTHGFWHFEDFVEGRTLPVVLAPFLLPFRDLPYRAAIDGWIRALPLSVVQVYRGKGIYFTPLPGRSFAPTMPCSNTTYKSNVGMQTGLWVEIRRGPLEGTAQNFVHEFGHILDYVMLQGGYGGYRAPHQFPGFRKALPAKEQVFGIRDAKVPQTPHGYVSRYARTNAQESFAEHFRAYVLEREVFRKKAEAEEAQGHPELMEKYRFMERLLDETPTTLERLSPAFLEQDAHWREARGRIARLEKARKLLGAKAPKAIDDLIEALSANAFAERTKRDEAAEATLVRRITKAVGRIRDRELAGRALAAILGMTLELKADRGATSGKPAFTATVRGADEGQVKGALRLGTRTPGRFGPAPEATEFELSAGATRRARWAPDTGEDLSPFVAVATAELTWNKRRFVLTSEIACRPSIPMWNVVGPFANPGGATGDVAHAPETDVDLSATYESRDGEPLAWKPVGRPENARIDAEFVLDLAKLLGAHEEVAAYAVVWAHVPKATDARLALGSADGAVAWVNGERVFAWLDGRREYRSKAHSVPIRLEKGANQILVKVTLAAKAWRLGAHLTGPDGAPLEGLRYALEP